jgi:hypothetical protein
MFYFLRETAVFHANVLCPVILKAGAMNSCSMAVQDLIIKYLTQQQT